MTEHQQEPCTAPRGKGGVSSKPDPLTDQDIRLHALNLAVAGRRDSIRFAIGDDGQPTVDFADQCVADARKYEAYLHGTPS